MQTRCKFQVEKVTKYNGNYEQITLNAVYGGTAENVSQFAAPPAGDGDLVHDAARGSDDMVLRHLAEPRDPLPIKA